MRRPQLVVVASLVCLSFITPIRTFSQTRDTQPLVPFKTYGFSGGEYAIAPDSNVQHDGKPTLSFVAIAPTRDAFSASSWTFEAVPYRGKRIRLFGMVKTSGVDGTASLWLRIDGPTKTMFDNMRDRALSGDRDWTRLSIVLDVPPDASTVVYGGLLQATRGSMWMDAPVVEIVGDDVRATGAALPSIPSPNDPSKLTPAQRVIALDELRKASTPLVTVDPTAPLTDLRPFERAVGDARLVGLGEASHGTSEFFDMKDRLFRDLVAKKNFTVFAIEANQPEAREMDEYVTKGTGDPAHALKSMYFWTWQTVEVLNLAKWMRSYNVSPGRHPTLHFAGFDMQTPDVAVSLVTQFAKQHDAEAGVAVERAYACIPHGSDQKTKMSREDQISCSASIRTVRDIIRKFSPDGELEHDARIVEQYAEMNLTPSASPGDVRDKAMAENVEWLLNVKYTAAKLVLWAHNYHISNLGRADRPSMGTWLRERHGKDFYRLGFAFDHGTIRAFRPQHGLGIQTIPAAPPSSIEAMLREDGSLVFVNLRDLPPGVLLDWLNGAVWQREIGAVWDPNYADNYYTTVKLAQRFDGLIFVTESHAAQTIANTKGRPLLPVLAAVEQNSAAEREEIARLQRTKPLDRSATQSGSGGGRFGPSIARQEPCSRGVRFARLKTRPPAQVGGAAGDHLFFKDETDLYLWPRCIR